MAYVLVPDGYTLKKVTKLQKEMPDPQDAVNLISKLTNNQQLPMANKGMKMRKRYTQGGRF